MWPEATHCSMALLPALPALVSRVLGPQVDTGSPQTGQPRPGPESYCPVGLCLIQSFLGIEGGLVLFLAVEWACTGL